MIQKMSDEHKIKFLESEKPEEKQVQAENVSKKTLETVAQEQKAKKLNNKYDKDRGMMGSHSIFSARTEVITDEGGPVKFIKGETSNTIFDSNKIPNVAMDNKTKTIQEKEIIATNKRIAEEKRMNDMVESLKKTDLTKASAVSPVGEYSGTNYKTPIGNMSIFDTKDFQRLAEQTGGEKISQAVNEKKAYKDESWKNSGKVTTTKDVTQNLMDSLFKRQEK